MSFDFATHRIVPPLGHVVIDVDPPEQQRGVIFLRRSDPTFTATVIDCADDVDVVKVGDRVVVQLMSGHRGMTEIFANALGRRIAVVPCCRLPTPRRSEEYAERLARLRWLQKGKPHPDGRPSSQPLTEKDREEMFLHELALHEIKQARRACGRDRLLPPFEDVAQAEGVLAVIED